VISLFVTDVTLLLIMLAGLLRIRRRGGGSLKFGRFLWKQVGDGGFCCCEVVTLIHLTFLRVSFGLLLRPPQKPYKR
jgi:hypothetical protein